MRYNMGKLGFVRKKSPNDDVQHRDSDPEKLWKSIFGDIQTSAGQECEPCSFMVWDLMKPQPKLAVVQPPVTESRDSLNDLLSSHPN